MWRSEGRLVGSGQLAVFGGLSAEGRELAVGSLWSAEWEESAEC